MSTEQAGTTENRFLLWLKRKWLAIILVALVVFVVIQNGLVTGTATVAVLWAQISLPTWLLVVILVLIGAIVGWMFARNRAARNRRR
ncbi:lipopolysaccharide assembly protein LapA domain-containing protein [Agrococcus sp. KRD186]|uniref:lipopolysaccharide assembly protein LapA domain-containing protein n=1 Tax=Agrococcus sp. KRD186 TaxID=2729730 RepID=UPI0019D14C5F|nr:lipopolysaccharide assembly protein LapA domain-containing protein [Agrococcus sp. KRD186]